MILIPISHTLKLIHIMTLLKLEYRILTLRKSNNLFKVLIVIKDNPQLDQA
jgi:hypothetical protein